MRPEAQLWKPREALEWAREALGDASERDRLHMLSQGVFDSYDEAMENMPHPAPANDTDPMSRRRWLVQHAKGIRAYVEKHGDKWTPQVRTRWLVAAEEAEDRAQRSA